MQKDGAKMVGIVEWDGSVYCKEGLNTKEIKDYITKTGGLKGYPKGTYYADESAMY